MERCCFAQLLKVVHSVSRDRCFFMALRKAIRYSVNHSLNFVSRCTPGGKSRDRLVKYDKHFHDEHFHVM